VPIGEPKRVREGKDATVVSLSYSTLDAMKAANELAKDGIEVDLIDLRTIAPLDDAMILESVARTGRLVVVDPGTLTAGFSGEIVARVVDKAFKHLKTAPIRIALPDCPTPTTRALSNYYYPTPQHVVAAVRKTMGLPFEADPFIGINPADKTLDKPDRAFTGPF
jgi:pyruvate dehydrogenase E1 component beta subunit